MNNLILIRFHDEKKAQDFMCNYVESDHYQKTVYTDEKDIIISLLNKHLSLNKEGKTDNHARGKEK